MPKIPIYLDYAASTPVDERVTQKMLQSLNDNLAFGNPTANHAFGTAAKDSIETARQQIAELIHAVPRQILFTSGATEANNLAIKGVADFYRDKGKHIITMATEHKSVLEPCQSLENQGYDVTYLKPKLDANNPNGFILPEQIQAVLRPDTILVSVMHANNETGVIQDIAAIGHLTRNSGVFFHVDAVQSVGKLSIDVEKMGIDLLSISAHKTYGPKGIGALYIGDNPRVRLKPLLEGGGQERKFRAGTLPTHQIVGMAEALRLASTLKPQELPKIKALREKFWAGINDLPGVFLNVPIELSLPTILNIRFEGVAKEAFLAELKDLAFSSASACNTMSIEPSHVLLAMGLTPTQADSSFRFSFGRFTTLDEIDFAVNRIREVYKK